MLISLYHGFFVCQDASFNELHTADILDTTLGEIYLKQRTQNAPNNIVFIEKKHSSQQRKISSHT